MAPRRHGPGWTPRGRAGPAGSTPSSPPAAAPRARGRRGGPVRLDLAGRPGDIVSLLPLGDAAGVTTVGLRYPLDDEDLPAGPARGGSNGREGRPGEGG